MNFLDVLKKCEPNVSQISRDAGVSRQATYLWVDNHLPDKSVFESLKAMDKYHDELVHFDYDSARGKRPVGRPPKGA